MKLFTLDIDRNSIEIRSRYTPGPNDTGHQADTGADGWGPWGPIPLNDAGCSATHLSWLLAPFVVKEANAAGAEVVHSLRILDGNGETIRILETQIRCR